MESLPNDAKNVLPTATLMAVVSKQSDVISHVLAKKCWTRMLVWFGLKEYALHF